MIDPNPDYISSSLVLLEGEFESLMPEGFEQQDETGEFEQFEQESADLETDWEDIQ